MSSQELGMPFWDNPLASRYEIGQQLASKAGRLTLLARDRSSGELVVVKILSFGSDFEWDALKLFEREAQTLKTLSYPAIPRYLDFFELDSANGKGFALVQSYVAGKSLEEYLKAGRTFSEAEVKQLALSLLEILIYLHGRKPPVIHRDIKPSNILLGDRTGNSIGQVYLVDFGSVQTLAAKEGGTMTIVGTYGYMPPEQFGDRTVPASDLYSLGATLIYLVTGTHPADLPHKDGKIQFKQELLSPAFAHWLRWMTEPSLDRRLASAQDARQALEQPQKDFAPLVVSKPFGSKIKLNKDANSLEILMPRKGFSAEIGTLILFAIAWNTGIALWTSITVFSPMGINFFFALFSLPFWGSGIGMVGQILSTLFGRVRLYLNQQQISQTYEIFGIPFNRRRSVPIQNINQLELEYLGEVVHKVIIWAGVHKYELAGYSHITEPELDWLASELSDWLGIPITRAEKTTPFPPKD
jgi:serine/threonine protein kinase